jgi:superfamily II DNA or RNA helicase
MNSASRKALLLKSIEGCSSWDDIHSKWASFSSEDKGARFEDLTQAFLEVHETYAKEFVNIWRPDEVPAAIAKKLKLRVPEWGIDLVGETRSGEYWSIQCKYLQDTDQELSHRIIASSVATTFESSRGFSYLLVCTTTQRVTNHYDHNPKVLFYGLPIWQQIDAAFLDTLRNKLAGKKVALTPYSPRKHQINAIQDGLKHFKEGKAARGKLIMPCGTGKSLTAWFLAQALGSKRVVIAVPSLSLVKQTLGVWTREAYHNNIDVKWICVCSDETAGRAEQDDVAVKVKDLGVPCHTSPDEIARELKTNEDCLTVVFTTYQSGQVLATAARKAKYVFDLGIMDEAHKTVGDGDKLFSHLIHDHNIEIRQRVFMTATERRFSGSSDKILSMDDPEVYGETFHLLTFKKAMEVVDGERPILCDYNVITIGVSRHEVKELIQKNLFVRPDSGKWDEEMEADMLAAMVALRKAMKEYPIKHAVSFHGSIKRAEQFREYNDSFTQEFPSFGDLSTFHVSGQTPTGTRSNVIKQFAKADRSLVTNARCLTEGVDVPSIDCVLFADPKKSKVDIVQAVGRALRPAQGKKLGYVILPVLHDEGSGELKESGAFKEVIEMLAKLASQDERIIDEFRLISQGQIPTGSERVRFEFGERIAANVDIAQFTNELQIKCWDRLAKITWRPFEEARDFIRSLGLKSQNDWFNYSKGALKERGERPRDIPSCPNLVYKDSGWISFGDWTGSGFIAPKYNTYLPFTEAREIVRRLGLKNQKEWIMYTRGEIPGLPPKPKNIPSTPERTYKSEGWVGLGDWIGAKTLSNRQLSAQFTSFEKAKEFALSLKLKSEKEWRSYCRGLRPDLPQRPSQVPAVPPQTYKTEWQGWGVWLGTSNIKPGSQTYLPFLRARKFVRQLKLRNSDEWDSYAQGLSHPDNPRPPGIPYSPGIVYKNRGWIGMGDWLGTGTISNRKKSFLTFNDARKYVLKLRLKSETEWRKFCAGKLKFKRPSNIPSNPDQNYADSGWVDWKHFLGSDNISNREKSRNWRLFSEARSFVRALGLNSSAEWRAFAQSDERPSDIPAQPENAYKSKGWISYPDWLGSSENRSKNSKYLDFHAARDFARSLKLKKPSDWKKYTEGKIKGVPPLPSDVPATPYRKYAESGWISTHDWLGLAPKKKLIPYHIASEIVRRNQIRTGNQYRDEISDNAIHHTEDGYLPKSPPEAYSDKWTGWGDFLQTGKVANQDRAFLPFPEAKKFVRSLKLVTFKNWKLYSKGKLQGTGIRPPSIPSNPNTVYAGKGWVSFRDWIG